MPHGDQWEEVGPCSRLSPPDVVRRRTVGISYREFASNGHALAEAQHRVAESFDIDAVTVCSDAFRVSADLGGEIVFPESAPPHLVRPLVRSREDIRSLRRIDPTESGSRTADRVLGAQELVKSAGGEQLVLGWVDMPFAEACSVCGVTEFLMMTVDEPKPAHELLDILTGIVIDFSLAQLEAGAPMIGAGDAAASLISPAAYREFALPYERRACRAIHDHRGLMKLHICGNTSNLLGDMATVGADLINIDHVVDLAAARETIGKRGTCIKGNLDPVADLLQSTPEACSAKAVRCIETCAGIPYMLSPGCEVPAAVSDEVFEAFCRAPRLLLES